MTDLLAARPVPVSRVWSGSAVIAENVEGDDLGDVVNLHSGASAWWVMGRQGDRPGALLHQAAAALELDELAIQDLTAEDRRTKFEELSQARLVTTNAAFLDPQSVEFTVRPVSLVVTDRALICLVDPVSPDFDPARLLVQHSQQLASGGVDLALQLVLGAVITSYEVVVEWLEDASDDLADELFAARPLSKDKQLQAFKLRTALSRLRRLTEPMRSVMEKLADSQPDSPASRGWLLLSEQHHRVANAADSLREVMASVLDTSLALANAQMNRVMKQLSAWAAIIAVPTLITGFAGQNVNFPLDGTTAGFWLYFALLVTSSSALYLWFRRRGWV